MRNPPTRVRRSPQRYERLPRSVRRRLPLARRVPRAAIGRPSRSDRGWCRQARRSRSSRPRARRTDRRRPSAASPGSRPRPCQPLGSRPSCKPQRTPRWRPMRDQRVLLARSRGHCSSTEKARLRGSRARHVDTRPGLGDDHLGISVAGGQRTRVVRGVIHRHHSTARTLVRGKLVRHSVASTKRESGTIHT
jgi:hypothetical protein